ncbi:MAG TPA: phospholipase D-like domain-containing protein [Opitutaceae bacterium]|nr:phospholipase D-like domain-containing protein [Opitutaceae bacterium]
MHELLEHPFVNGVLPHLLTIAGFLLALFLVARLMSEKRQPGNTVAWLLVIVLIPYVGVPLFLLFGGRKLKRLTARKLPLCPVLPGNGHTLYTGAASATAQTVIATGACPPVGGNTVRLLTTGEDAYAALEENIRGARHFIHITTFILGRDEVGRRLVRLLAQRAKEGVKVRLLLDAVGCLFSGRGFVDPLREAGGEVVRFLPVLPLQTRASANLRNHRKIAVFDHQRAIVGGHNLAREYMGPTPYRKRWHDFGIVVAGPAAALINEVFLADWSFASKADPAALHREIPDEITTARGKSELQVVASGPDVEGDPLYEALISMIQESERSIWIVTPYFIPDEVLFRSLLVKARAGRDVTLIVPVRSNHPVTDYARRYYLRELAKAGAHVRLFHHGMLHSKAVIVDDRLAIMGSANFDLRSLFVNFEIGVLIYSERDVLAMKGWATDLLNQSHAPRVERAKKSHRLGNLAEDVSRLLAPLL